MKTLALTLILLCGTAAIHAEEAAAPAATQAAPAAKPKTTTASKKKKPASKKPVEKTAVAAPAADHKTSMNQSLQEWLAKMKKRVSSARTKQNKLVAVAAVRGDEKSDPPPLYWKGKEGEKPVDNAEMDEFNKAVETAMSGDHQEAKLKLQQFVDTHPKSPLVADAKETINKLSTTEPEPEAPTPEAKTQ